jgi:hypothetical protein
VFDKFKRQRPQQRLDLASVRDTLLYIESDLAAAPELTRLTDAIHSALAEIDRLELSNASFDLPEITAARFVPARL